MPNLERVTITLPREIVEAIDRVERNRSRFILEALRQELERRKREELRRSLDAPHPEAGEIAELGFDAWALDILDEDAAGLVDVTSGTAVRWLPGKGWTSSSEESRPRKPTSRTGNRATTARRKGRPE